MTIHQQFCKNHPWLIEPGPNQYLYVKLPGTIATNRTKCETKNRIVVHTAGKLQAAVCPQSSSEWHQDVVEVFSDGWTVSGNAMMVAAPQDAVRSIAVEYIINEDITSGAEYSVTWLELTRRYATIFIFYSIFKIIVTVASLKSWY
jgi:hypothetical protein